VIDMSEQTMTDDRVTTDTADTDSSRLTQYIAYTGRPKRLRRYSLRSRTERVAENKKFYTTSLQCLPGQSA